MILPDIQNPLGDSLLVYYKKNMIATIIDNYLSTHKLLPTKQMSQQKRAKTEPAL